MTTRILDLAELAQFDAAKPVVRVIAQSHHAKQVLFSLKAGQQIHKHHSTSQIAVQVIIGRVTFSAADQDHDLQPGQLLVLERGVLHALRATVDAVVLVTMTPDPASASGARTNPSP